METERKEIIHRSLIHYHFLLLFFSEGVDGDRVFFSLSTLSSLLFPFLLSPLHYHSRARETLRRAEEKERNKPAAEPPTRTFTLFFNRARRNERWVQRCDRLVTVPFLIHRRTEINNWWWMWMAVQPIRFSSPPRARRRGKRERRLWWRFSRHLPSFLTLTARARPFHKN